MENKYISVRVDSAKTSCDYLKFLIFDILSLFYF